MYLIEPWLKKPFRKKISIGKTKSKIKILKKKNVSHNNK
jgi:hypothetical protein